MNTNSNTKSAARVANLEKQIQRLSMRKDTLEAQGDSDSGLQPVAAATKIQTALRRWRRLQHGGRPIAGAGCPRVAQCALRLQHVNAKLASEDLPAEKRACLEQRRANLTARLSLRAPHAPGGKGGGHCGHAAGPAARLEVLQGRLAAVAARLAGGQLSADERLHAAARHVEIAGRIEHLKRRLAHGKGHGKGFAPDVHWDHGKVGKGGGPHDHGKGFGHGGEGFGHGDEDHGGKGFSHGGQVFGKGGKGFSMSGECLGKGGKGSCKGGKGFGHGGKGNGHGGKGCCRGGKGKGGKGVGDGGKGFGHGGNHGHGGPHGWAPHGRGGDY